MRVRLKGINRASMTLADGRVVTYYYAWKGGPRLRGEPGSPEFHASYNEAVSAKIAPPAGVLLALIRWFEETSEFGELAERTKADYRKKLALIEHMVNDDGAWGNVQIIHSTWRSAVGKVGGDVQEANTLRILCDVNSLNRAIGYGNISGEGGGGSSWMRVGDADDRRCKNSRDIRSTLLEFSMIRSPPPLASKWTAFITVGRNVL